MLKHAFAGTLLCVSLSSAAAEPSKAVVLKAARMFDATSDTLSSPGVLVVENGRIAGVGASAAVPPGAEVIELGDATLLPGFIDAHVHLSGEMGPSWFKDFYDHLMRFPAEQAHYAAANARKTLDA